MNSRISVITVCKNDNTNLFRTINSVESQTYRDVELLIICGDNSNEDLEEIITRCNKINYYSIGNDNGIYDAMNKGIEQSTGEWIISKCRRYFCR